MQCGYIKTALSFKDKYCLILGSDELLEIAKNNFFGGDSLEKPCSKKCTAYSLETQHAELSLDYCLSG